MPRKSANGKTQLTEVLKVRHFVMNMLYRHGVESVMIPSSRQLALQFGIARSTVQIALEKMISEGFLFSKAGIGTFTNPLKGFVFPDDKPAPLIGLICGDGKHFFYDYHICRMMSEIGVRLSSFGWNIRNITLAGSSTDTIEAEIRSAFPDGLVWVFPSQEHETVMNRLAASGIKIAAYSQGFEFKNIGTVSSEYQSMGAKAASEFIAEGRRNLLFAITGVSLISLLEGFRDAYKKSGIEYTENILSEGPAVFSHELEEALSSGLKPDVLLINGRHSAQAMQILSRHGIDYEKECRILAIQHVLSSAPFKGILLEEDFELAGASIFSIMQKLMNGGEPEVKHTWIPVKIKYFN